jgi:hypothetical protein
MPSCLVCGQASTAPLPPTAAHLPTRRAHRYPSDTNDAEWQVMSRHVPAGGAGRAVELSGRRSV